MKKLLYAAFFAAVILTMLSGCTAALTKAAINDDARTVKQLLAEQNPSQKDLNKAGQMAAMYGHHKIVKILLDKGADVNYQGWDGEGTPLFRAAYEGHPDTAAVLLEHDANIYKKGQLVHSGGMFGSIKTFYITPLAAAAWKGHSNVVAVFLNKIADPDAAVDAAIIDLEAISTRWPEAKAGQAMLQRRLAKMSHPDLSATAFNQTIPVATPPPTPLTQMDMTGTSLDFGNYYALVIGNNNYQHVAKLNTAINDAQSVEYMLQNDYGFKVKLIADGTRSNILQALDAYRAQLTQNDNLLIYYAGHGYYDKDAERGYWLPVDAQTTTRANWISNVDVTDTLKATRAKHVMIVADSCYSGTLTRSVHIALRNPTWLPRIVQKKSRTVLTSGGLEPVADSGGGEHSVFAAAFLKALQENTGVLDGTLLFSKIRRPIMLNSDQTPQYSDIRKAGHDGGDFLFVKTR